MNSESVFQTVRTSFFRILLISALLVSLALVLMPNALATNNALAAGTGPCDIYASGGTPCVAAHSTVRALYGSYNGSLYQVRRSSDNATMNIGVLSAGGFANAAAQDNFCSGTSCVITIIYDQSGNGNDLTPAPPGGVGGQDDPANATALPLTVGGHHVYGVYISPGIGYRNNNTTGIATGDQPEGMYAIFDGTHYNNQCCFDYGNAETNNLDTGNGHMEAIYFGNCSFWGTGAGSGPWVMADLENGLFSGTSTGYNGNDQTVNFNYLTAIIKGESNHWAIRTGNAQSGGLTTQFDGPRPNASGYNPMHKEGAIILGIGGDNSNSASGSFFEGAMTSGYPSNSTEDSVQSNIVAAGYGVSGPTPTPPPAQQDPIAWYKFDGNANDSSGNGYNATNNGGSYVTGEINQAVSLNGSSNYVSLPTGIVSSLSDFSIATWVDLNSSSNWNRVFDFGNGTDVNMFLTPQNGSTNAVRFAITTSGNGSEQQITGSSALPTGSWVHVAVTKSGSTGRLYVNGSQVGSNSSMSLSPSSLGSTSQNWIGRSQYSSDPYLDGRVDDFRIYNRALSSSEVSNLASGGGGSPTNTPAPTFTPTVGPSATPTSTPSGGGGLPSPWQDQDVGSVGQAGSASYNNGTFTVDGGGADIWGTSDAFHYVYQSLNGDGEVVARVTSLENTNSWAKAGVMIRESLNANSTQAMMVVTAGNGLAFQRRTSTGGSSTHTAGSSASAPYWVRLVRSGSTFTAYSSSNGTSWSQVGSDSINMASNVYVGLAVTAHDNSTLATAQFTNVSVSSGGGSNPTATPAPTATPGSGGSATYQAEDANLGGGVSVDTNHTGYNGTGFVNFPTSGGYVTYQNVDGGSGGSSTLIFRFALGNSARTGTLTVNGSSQNITFQSTGSWDTWDTMNVTVNLNSGTNNTIELQSTGQDLANQDQMTVNSN